MATTVVMSLAAIGGGTIQGNFGTYVAGSDSLITADTRDVPTLLIIGATYVNKRSATYGTIIPVAAATAGQLIASAALSNGALAIANQPDVMRQGAMRVDPGTSAVTGGTFSITYKANDGTTQIDNLPVAATASGLLTSFLTKGVVRIVTASLSGIVGGTSPHIQVDTTNALSFTVDPGAVDLVVNKETQGGASGTTGDVAVGTVNTSTLGTITPTNAANATRTYSWAYAYTSPNA